MSTADTDPWDIPLRPPPPGVVSNFVDPPSLKKDLVILNSVFLTLAILAVVVRISSRYFIIKSRLGWDDVTCVLATAGSITQTALIISAINVGYGRHEWDIRLLSMIDHRKAEALTLMDEISTLTFFLVKLSFLLLFYRLFHISNTARQLIYGGYFLSIITFFPAFVIGIYRTVNCTTVAAFSLKICQETDVSITVLFFGVLGLVSDFYILMIPITQLSKLQIEKKRKVAVFIPFLAGFVACCMTIVRLGVMGATLKNHDTVYDAALWSMFSTVEMNVAIICSCMISFPAVYKSSRQKIGQIYDRLITSSGRSRTQLSSAQAPSSRTHVNGSESSKPSLKRYVSPGWESDDGPDAKTTQEQSKSVVSHTYVVAAVEDSQDVEKNPRRTEKPGPGWI